MKFIPSAILPGVASALALALLAGVHPLRAFPAGAGRPASLSAAAGAPDKDTKDSVDTIIREAMANHRIPSLVVAVVQNGKTVFQKAYGHDPLYTYANNAPSNSYALGPASQVLTGGAVLLLVSEGKVGLDDPVSKYLPGLPEAWRPITIAQLLSHRSGLPAMPKEAKTFAAAVEEAGKQPLRFKPGSRRAENSADFEVLGQVVEKVSGETYLKYMDRTVFKRMKLSDTGDFSQLVFRFAAPQDFRFDTNANTVVDMPMWGEATASSMSKRGSETFAKTKTVDLLYQGMPGYSIPSKGLASNIPDILRIVAAIFDPGPTHLFDNPDYFSLAPGWKGCDTGKDRLLTTSGIVSTGYGINLSVVPSHKAALLLVWKMEKGSEVTLLHDESQDILETALGLPVSTWICTSQVEESDDEDQP